MIEINEIFSDSDKRVAIWCESVSDTNDLAMMCEHVAANNVHLISVSPEVVSDVWAYLEKNKVKILTRYDVGSVDSDVYDLGAKITSVCKTGANGIQLFIKMRDFERVLDSLLVVRDDLFFGHDLCVVMDTKDLDINNLDFIFQKLRDIRADAFVLTLNEDTGNRSDFVGRIYALLQQFNFEGELHFILGNNFDRIDQVVRLTECLRPELSDKLRFFLDY
jgi:hypothetical protein